MSLSAVFKCYQWINGWYNCPSYCTTEVEKEICPQKVLGNLSSEGPQKSVLSNPPQGPVDCLTVLLTGLCTLQWMPSLAPDLSLNLLLSWKSVPQK